VGCSANGRRRRRRRIGSVFVALGIQHAMRIRLNNLPSVAYPVLPYFPHDITNYTIFGKRVTE
jgi:hypothetical protein